MLKKKLDEKLQIEAVDYVELLNQNAGCFATCRDVSITLRLEPALEPRPNQSEVYITHKKKIVVPNGVGYFSKAFYEKYEAFLIEEHNKLYPEKAVTCTKLRTFGSETSK